MLPSISRAARWLEATFDFSAGRDRILAMEGMRAVAILLVFCVHFHALFGAYLDSHSVWFRLSGFLAACGHSGVDLFFVISGFLIYGVVLAKYKGGYWSFVRRRVQRIFPAAHVTLLLYLLLYLAFPDQSKLPSELGRAALYLLANALMLPGLLDLEHRSARLPRPSVTSKENFPSRTGSRYTKYTFTTG